MVVGFFVLFSIYLICISVLFACMLCEGVRSPGTELTGSCEQPHGCWELNVGLLEEQLVLATTEPSLQQPPLFFF